MFVTFEGPEGAGKSTALKSVAKTLRERGLAVTTTREPGAGPLGEGIRVLLLGGTEVPAASELFLFLADRAQNVETIIRPALARGEIVLGDRYADSTVVYQGVARGLGADLLRGLNDLATSGLKPDLTLLFDIEPAVGLARLPKKDRMDSEPLAFHQKVREAFLAEASREPQRWVVLDATKDPAEIARLSLEAVLGRLGNETSARRPV